MDGRDDGASSSSSWSVDWEHYHHSTRLTTTACETHEQYCGKNFLMASFLPSSERRKEQSLVWYDDHSITLCSLKLCCLGYWPLFQPINPLSFKLVPLSCFACVLETFGANPCQCKYISDEDESYTYIYCTTLKTLHHKSETVQEIPVAS